MNSTITNSTVYLENEWDFSVLPILILSIHAFNFIFSLPLNIYAIVLLFSSFGVMDPTDIFSLNQAFAEIFFVVFGLFHSLCGLNLCLNMPLGFFLGISITARCLFQCSVCFDHFMAVVHPVTFLSFKPLRYRIAYSLMIWIMSVGVGITCGCMYPRMPYKVLSIMYIFVLSLDIFCGVSVLKKLKRPGPRDMVSNVGQMSAAKRKAFQIVSVNLLIFLAQNIPTCVTFGLEQTQSAFTFRMISVISLAIFSVTAFLQPLAVLRRAGKLVLILSVCCPTPSSICCSSSKPA